MVIPRPTRFAMVDDRVWRGSRPDAYQAAALVKDGVHDVINLEWEEDDKGIWPPRSPFGVPVDIHRICDFEPLPLFAPSIEDSHVIATLKAIKDGPAVVYVHCRSGQNRTGVVIAAYRLVIQRDDGLAANLDTVLAEFKSFRGWWAWADEGYIRSIAERREWFLEQVTG